VFVSSWLLVCYNLLIPYQEGIKLEVMFRCTIDESWDWLLVLYFILMCDSAMWFMHNMWLVLYPWDVQRYVDLWNEWINVQFVRSWRIAFLDIMEYWFMYFSATSKAECFLSWCKFGRSSDRIFWAVWKTLQLYEDRDPSEGWRNIHIERRGEHVRNFVLSAREPDIVQPTILHNLDTSKHLYHLQNRIFFC
jgi:hypothetical protein